jgi:hypothetical protein
LVCATQVCPFTIKSISTIHDQSCCTKLFCATQVCPFTIKSISTIHDQSCCTARNVAQHDWSCMGPLRSTISTLSSNVNVIFSLLTFNHNL